MRGGGGQSEERSGYNTAADETDTSGRSPNPLQTNKPTVLQNVEHEDGVVDATTRQETRVWAPRQILHVQPVVAKLALDPPALGVLRFDRGGAQGEGAGVAQPESRSRIRSLSCACGGTTGNHNQQVIRRNEDMTGPGGNESRQPFEVCESVA